MAAKRYVVTLIGETPFLMHCDNVEWSDFMGAWRKDPANKKKSKAGDDRSPAFTWIGYLYHEAGKLVVPADNLMTLLREGGKKCPTGKGQGTYKSQTQSGIVVDQSAWPLLVDGKEIPHASLKELGGEADFEKHMEAAKAHGFELFVKRAKVGAAKHIRVRPRFDSWSCSGSLTVLDDTITEGVLRNILNFAGAYSGLGDWRPSSPKSPGPFGKFSVELKAM